MYDLINDAKKKKKKKETGKNEIKHGKFHTQLLNFKHFDDDHLVNFIPPEEKYYIYYDTDTKEIDEIKFPDYKKWYKEGRVVWKSHAYRNAQFKLEYVNHTMANRVIRRRHESAKNKRKIIENFRKNE